MDGIPDAIKKTKMTKGKLQNSRVLSPTICHFTSEAQIDGWFFTCSGLKKQNHDKLQNMSSTSIDYNIHIHFGVACTMKYFGVINP
jgi:hypothetical protein